MKRLSIAAAAVLAACAPRPDVGAARTAILAADSAWLAAAHSGDVDSAASFWTADAHVLSPGQPPAIGHEAVHKMVADAFATPGFSISWQTTDVVVAPSADVAWSFGPTTITFPGAKGAIDTMHASGVVIWRKGDDGRWRAAVDISTPLPTAGGAPGT